MHAGTRRTSLTLVGLTLLAFGLRIYHLSYQSLWRDEVDALRFATQALPDLLAMFRRPGQNGPLFFLMLRPWLAAAGHSEFALRFPSAWAGTLAVPITYALMRRLLAGTGRAGGERRPASVLALLMATGPYLLWYGQEAKMYALLTVLVPLQLLLAIDLSRRGGWWRWLFLYLLTAISFYVHLLAVLAVPLQALWLLILPDGPAARRRRWRALAYLAFLVLPYLPLAWWELPTWLSPSYQPGQPFVSLPDILAVLTMAFSRGILAVEHLTTLLPATLALLAGVFLWALSAPPILSRSRIDGVIAVEAPGGAGAFPRLGAREQVHSAVREAAGALNACLDPRRLWCMTRLGLSTRAWRVVVALVLWLILPPLEIYGVSLGMPIFLDRYLIWVMPAFLALVALGIAVLGRAWRPLGPVALAAVVSLNLYSAWQQTSMPIKPDFRDAARFVMSHRQPDDLLIFQIPYNRYTFTYYSGEGFAWMDGPYTNRGESETSIDELMARGTAGTRAAWLIATEVSLWDARDLARSWLASHGTVTDQADFTRVSVTRYVLRK